ncbi:hypothetical protein A4D02_35045 [Niastella koreensis]|uniref:PEGA domain-containing protein n=2 Tax=Niastella koreensis TaxID=354356 RepID=G8TP92_NIAKG|nr:hypothetical protein [Niastella koreensis]AEV96698.1 hypothetical protein Niako_0300 [Niastella koreensis GR20-10]OQP44357.1 hypothetical protein A4D02_35045 [Niastella koreensis]
MYLTKTLVTAALFLVLSSCATIVSKTKYPVTIDSYPRDANITITNRRGEQIFTGETPALVRLKSGSGYFRREIYEITISKKGYVSRTVEIRATLNGWYFGNIFYFQTIGFLVVDPATGAMYRINQLDVYEKLEVDSKTKNVTQREPQLHIYDINEIPEAWKSKLVAIQ